MQKADVVKIQDEILRAALPHVPFGGWSAENLRAGAQDAGYDVQMVRAVFPAGVMSALDHFADLADREMLRVLEDVNVHELRVRDRVGQAVKARFVFLNAHKEAFRLALQYWMMPTKKPRALKIVWRTADRIWDFAGDTASDYNRYTKRGLLSGILAPASLVFLNDESADLNITHGFVDRRIENVMQLGKVIGRFSRKA